MATGLKFLFVGFLGLVLAACQSVPAPETGTAYLVRHAEKVTSGEAMVVADPKDPPLTAAGQSRAKVLAEMLEGEPITAIWSSDYKRTRDTAAPLADLLNLEVQIYDPGDLEGLAAQLRANPNQTVLVVGHSNTTPQLAEALGGEGGTPIYEKSEYDRLYVVDLNTGSSEIRRFGAPFIDPRTDE
jgi:probable phosphoglycerate mutase